MSLNSINWPALPNGSPVPDHRKSWKAITENKPVFCASSWKKRIQRGVVVGSWICGYCQKRSWDLESPQQPDTLADCPHCHYTNRISL